MSRQSLDNSPVLEYHHTGVQRAEVAVAVSRPSNRSIAIIVRYPNKLRFEIAIGCTISGVVVIVGNIIAAWYGGWPGFLTVAVITLVVLGLVLRMAIDAFSLHEWNVNVDGLTMSRVGPMGGRHTQHLLRSAIRDVRIRYVGGRRPTSYLVLQPSRWWQYRRGVFTGLGGNHLATIADLVREGLMMPKASWPSGRLIESAWHSSRA